MVLHEAEVIQGAVSLALVVCGQLVQVLAEASLGVTVVMRYADGGEAGHVATNVGFGVGRGSWRVWVQGMMFQGVFTVGNLMSWFLRLSLRGVMSFK